MKLHTQILLGLLIGLVAGAVFNVLMPGNAWVKWFASDIANTIGQLFLRLIFMTIIPLIFSALVLGVADLGDLRKIGRIGVKTLLFTVVISTVSVLIGITFANVFQPGVGIEEEGRQTLMQSLTENKQVTTIMGSVKEAEAKSKVQALLEIVPRNPLAEMVNALESSWRGGGLLAVMFFSLFFGIAMALAPQEQVKTLERAIRGVYEVMMQIINIAMKLAPLGVAGLMFNTAYQLGFDIIGVLLKYVLVVIAALALHQFGTYSLVLIFGARRKPMEFFRGIRSVMLTAFSTSSSNATLPTSIRATNENLKVNPDITHFVLTVGATANQNGTALYEGITVLFLAQFYGISLDFSQQVTVIWMSIIAGIGTAGVPGGSLPLIVMVLQSVGIPPEGIGVILGVDRILDMSRTVVNVTGDITLATWVDASERAQGRFPDGKMGGEAPETAPA